MDLKKVNPNWYLQVRFRLGWQVIVQFVGLGHTGGLNNNMDWNWTGRIYSSSLKCQDGPNLTIEVSTWTLNYKVGFGLRWQVESGIVTTPRFHLHFPTHAWRWLKFSLDKSWTSANFWASFHVVLCNLDYQPRFKILVLEGVSINPENDHTWQCILVIGAIFFIGKKTIKSLKKKSRNAFLDSIYLDVM